MQIQYNEILESTMSKARESSKTVTIGVLQKFLVSRHMTPLPLSGVLARHETLRGCGTSKRRTMEVTKLCAGREARNYSIIN